MNHTALMIVAAGDQPLPAFTGPTLRPDDGRRLVQWSREGNYGTVAFAVVKGVRPMVETHLLEEAETTF
jgi:hypothetical protein